MSIDGSCRERGDGSSTHFVETGLASFAGLSTITRETAKSNRREAVPGDVAEGQQLHNLNTHFVTEWVATGRVNFLKRLS